MYVNKYQRQVTGVSFASLDAVRLQLSGADMQTEYSKRARATTVKTFVRFLQAENAYLEYVNGCIRCDDSGQRFVSVMDKFGMHLAFHETRAGKPLARHSIMHYYRKEFRRRARGPFKSRQFCAEATERIIDPAS